MKKVATQFKQVFADPRYGRLPALLLSLTVVTGVVDAVSILQLGRVFVANMTGNVVFIAFAALGAPGFSLAASLVALGGFLLGAGAGGVITKRMGPKRFELLGSTALTELFLVALALVIAAAAGRPLASGTKDAIAGLLAVSMGLQNAAARHIAVPDMTTTVLTMTLTGIAADLRAKAGLATVSRRVLAVLSMFAGAVIGGVLVIHDQIVIALAVAALLLLVVSAAALHAHIKEGESSLGAAAAQ